MSEWLNKNSAASFQETVDTSNFVELNAGGSNRGDGGAGFQCTEVVISFTSTNGGYIADTFDNYTDNNFWVPPNTAVTIKGVTNCNELSAKSKGSGGSVHYRAQHYGGYIIAAG